MGHIYKLTGQLFPHFNVQLRQRFLCKIFATRQIISWVKCVDELSEPGLFFSYAVDLEIEEAGLSCVSAGCLGTFFDIAPL